MDYREMWERLREEIDRAIEEGIECGYNKVDSEDFDKFYIYERISGKMNDLESTVRVEMARKKLIPKENPYIKKSYLGIKTVIFNNPATVVIWEDGSKTVVKCQPGDEYNKETGLAMCIAKNCLGNKSNFNNIFKKYIEGYDPRGK